MDKLPIYEVTIDTKYQNGSEELGIDMIAFTDNPAILVKGVAFKSQDKKFFADEKKYRITAPAMIPMDIYRADEDGEYEARFKEEVIDEMHNKFMSNLNNKDLFNLEHNAEVKVPAFILEAWIVDNPKQDKAFSTFGIEVPKGTLMVTAQVTDKDYYNKLVESGQVGFSIEGFLAMQIPKEQLNKYSMKLPDGEHTIEGKVYTVENGEIISAVDVVIESETPSNEEEVVAEVAVEAPAVEVAMEDEEEKEEEVEMADESEEEEVVEVEAEVDPNADADAVLAIVQPLIDAVLAEIAEIRNEMSDSEDAPEEDVEVNMSAHVGFSRFVESFKS